MTTLVEGAELLGVNRKRSASVRQTRGIERSVLVLQSLDADAKADYKQQLKELQAEMTAMSVARYGQDDDTAMLCFCIERRHIKAQLVPSLNGPCDTPDNARKFIIPRDLSICLRLYVLIQILFWCSKPPASAAMPSATAPTSALEKKLEEMRREVCFFKVY